MYSVSLPLSHRLLLAVFAVSGAALTFLFGGNFPLAMSAMPILCALAFICSGFLPRPTLQSPNLNWLIAGVFIPVMLVLAWSLVQILPLPAGSHLASPFWSLQPDATPTISFNPADTLAQFAYATGLLVLAWGLFRAGQVNPRPLLVTLAVTITIAALYGIMVFATGNNFVLWLPKTSYLDSLSATFINRNSFATMAGLGILANLGLMLQRVGEISQRLNQRQRIKAFILLVLRPGLPWAFMAAICFVALVLTNSRAGLTASLFGVMVLLGSIAYVRVPARWPLAAMVGSILLVSFIVLAAAGATLGNRLSAVGADAAVRSGIHHLTGQLIGQYPLTGTGFGTFPEAFASVNSHELLATVPTRTLSAHNTYLELTAELGYPAMALLGLAVFSLLAACLHGLRIRRRAVIWPALGISAMALVGSHALADFSLSIPAVAFATLTLLMLGLAQSLPLAEETAKPKPSAFRPWYVLTPLGLALIALASWQTAANSYALNASPLMARIEYGFPVTRVQLLQTQDELESCLAINPNHPTCGFDLAHVYLSFATGYGLTGNNSQIATVYLAMAQQQYQLALRQSPANATAWYRLARIDSYMQEKPAAIAALNNSLFTSPAEPTVAYLRVPFMLAMLPYLNADDKALYTNNILSLWQKSPRGLALKIRSNRVIQPAFAALVADQPNITDDWQQLIKTPFPTPQPLGEGTENQ